MVQAYSNSQENLNPSNYYLLCFGINPVHRKMQMKNYDVEIFNISSNFLSWILMQPGEIDFQLLYLYFSVNKQ
jgi:hypothetical protein